MQWMVTQNRVLSLGFSGEQGTVVLCGSDRPVILEAPQQEELFAQCPAPGVLGVAGKETVVLLCLLSVTTRLLLPRHVSLCHPGSHACNSCWWLIFENLTCHGHGGVGSMRVSRATVGQ